MGGWPTVLTLFLVLVGAAYTLFMYSAVRRDDDEQHKNAGNPHP